MRKKQESRIIVIEIVEYCVRECMGTVMNIRLYEPKIQKAREKENYDTAGNDEQ